jgi:hypothetical protein
MSEDTILIVTEQSEPVIFNILSVGPQGPRGEPGGELVAYLAGETLGGNRMVILENDLAMYANCTNVLHGHRVIGMTVGAIMSGAFGDVRRSGVIEEVSWNWDTNTPIWLGENGLLTQTIPESGFSLIIGYPVTSTKVMIGIKEPIFLI